MASFPHPLHNKLSQLSPVTRDLPADGQSNGTILDKESVTLRICGIVGTTPLTRSNDAGDPSVSLLLSERWQPGLPGLLTQAEVPERQEAEVFGSLRASFSDSGVYLSPPDR